MHLFKLSAAPHLRKATADNADIASDLNSAAIYGAGAGYNLGNFTVSATIDKTALPLSPDASMKVSLTTAFVNGFYNFTTGTKVTPYLGAGAGYTIGRALEISGISAKLQDGFAWQIQGGIKVCSS